MEKNAMLLAIDIGNTNIVVALFKNDTPIHAWRLHSDAHRTGDEYGAVVHSFFRGVQISPSDITYAIVSSVVPALIGTFIGMVESFIGKKPFLVTPQILPLLPITVPKGAEHEVGSDLVCNAVEAFCRFKTASIVADFGTALSFTAVGHTGNILGVAITPGLGTAVNSLFANTAQLPAVPLEAPPSVLGTNTIYSIQAGVVLGFKGLVEYVIAEMKKQIAHNDTISPDDIVVVATGGLNSVLHPITSVFQHIDKQFTLFGLERIAGILIDHG
jgi:type III pantothenate kinase